jgi:hypothetical protein
MAASCADSVWHRDSQCGEDAFQTAIAIAKSQSARSQGPQESLALAKFYHSTVRPPRRTPCSAPALEGFAPG